MKITPNFLLPFASTLLGVAALAWSLLAPIQPAPVAQSLIRIHSKENVRPPQPTLTDFARVWHKQLFTPPPPAPIEQPPAALASVEVAKPKPTPDLKLKAILYSENVRLAVFAHHVTGATIRLAEGEEHGGLRIEKIHAEFVETIFAGEPLTIKVRNEETPSKLP